MSRYGRRYTLVEAHVASLDTREKVDVVVCEDCGALVSPAYIPKHNDFHNHQHLTLGKIG